MRHNKPYLSYLLIILLFSVACNTNSAADPDSESVKVDDKVQQKIKERADLATKTLARQKEAKAKIPQLPVIEGFLRETEEKEILAKLGEPSDQQAVKLEKVEQKVFFYKQQNFAIWLWRESDDQGPYQYRATMSLNRGKFDLPLHNVFTEDELRQVGNLFAEK
jgi:C4-type Zn-finger protein